MDSNLNSGPRQWPGDAAEKTGSEALMVWTRRNIVTCGGGENICGQGAMPPLPIGFDNLSSAIGAHARIKFQNPYFIAAIFRSWKRKRR